jgi:hypothetical protein
MATLRRLVIALVVLLCACGARSGDVVTTVGFAITAEADALKSAGESRDCALDPVESDLDDDDDDTTCHSGPAWLAFDDVAPPNTTPTRAWVREHELDPTPFQHPSR